MVRKARPDAAARDERGPALDAIRHSAERIWLAGLAAFTKARGSSEKTFESLAKEGAHLQSIARALAQERVSALSHSVDSVSQRLSNQAAQSWDHLEEIFEDRVARTLTRLGVPTSAEVQALMERVDALTTALRNLESVSASARSSSRDKTTAGAARARKSPAAKRGVRQPRGAERKVHGARS